MSEEALTTAALRTYRQRSGLSQRKLADVLGITPQYLNDLEHGKRALGEKYIGLLPEPIRGAVGRAAIEEHRAAIGRIREAMRAPPQRGGS